MSILTTFFNLIKPAKGDRYKVSDFDHNFDVIDTEMHRPPLSVNGITPGADRNLTLTEVPLAGNLSSDIAQIVTGTFIQRTSGGNASIEDGEAFLSSIRGNSNHTGQIAESLTLTVNAAPREEGDPITATINRDVFVSYVATSGTYTLTYTTAWSANPALYGVTVDGTPINGDEIVISYTKENRGQITVATPTSFNSTGWNLFNRAVGYARVCKYSDTYGFKIGGTYSLVEFSTTVSGTRTLVTTEDGYFNVPSDGFVFVTGSDATTYVYATFTDWTENYQGNFEEYAVDTIDLSEIMLVFPYGLCSVGNVRDEINLNTQIATRRIERIGYSAENLAAVIASGMPYDADENYIFAVMQTPNSSAISIDGGYSVSDHGIEYFTGSSVPVYAEILYGENLKDKLRTDVLTISTQSLTDAQKAQVRKNAGALGVVDIVNSLTSTATNKPLSAAQGKALRDELFKAYYGNATRQNTFLSSGACKYIRIGNIVLVHIMELIVSTAIPSESGIPANAFFIDLPRVGVNGQNFELVQYSTGASLRVTVGNTDSGHGGYIAPHYDTKQPSPSQYYGVLWYMAAQ